MTTIYSQLRVSCGLSATINSLQPEALKATTTQTLAHWLDVQWLKLTHNNDPMDPLVQLASGTREWKWAIVLDYILLRKIRSSLLLCAGLNPGQLVLEVEEVDLNWNTLTPAFIRILTRLNEMKEDWPLWLYDGSLADPTSNLSDPEFRSKSVKLIQSIKMFWEIFQSNLVAGPEAEWKNIFMNMVDFPESLTHNHVAFHVDHYKTDFELGSLLQSLGFEMDSTYGRGYPKSVIPNSVVLINRPEHWVCEDVRSRGTVLDSLTQGTDAIHAMDSFNYYKPLQNLRILRKSLPQIEKIFPDIEIEIEEEDLTEFPELELPETNNPDALAQQFHHSAAAAYQGHNYKKALQDKRIECALLEKGAGGLNLYQNLLEFTEWCLERDKFITARENIGKLGGLEVEIKTIQPSLKAKRFQVFAKLQMMEELPRNAIESLKKALELYQNASQFEQAYEIANSMGVAYARSKNYTASKEIYQQALSIAQQAQQNMKPSDGTTPQKYWPAILQAINKKIAYINKHLEENRSENTSENSGIERID